MHPPTKEVCDAQVHLESGAVMAFKFGVLYIVNMLLIGGGASAHSGFGTNSIVRAAAN